MSVEKQIEFLVGEIEDLQKKYTALDAVLRGNGDIGLKPRVKTLEDKWKSFEWYLRVILGIALADFFGRLLGLI